MNSSFKLNYGPKKAMAVFNISAQRCLTLIAEYRKSLSLSPAGNFQEAFEKAKECANTTSEFHFLIYMLGRFEQSSGIDYI